MGAFTTIAERIVRQPALTMPGNATGSEAACTALTGSQIRAICGLGTTDNVTFNTVTATTSVLTPLLNNTNAAALIVGNSTYGVTVPGVATFSSAITASADGIVGPSGDSLTFSSGPWLGRASSGIPKIFGYSTTGFDLGIASNIPLSWSGTVWDGSAAKDVTLSRNATGPKLSARAAGGFEVRNLAGSADAPLTASTGTFSGTVQSTPTAISGSGMAFGIVENGTEKFGYRTGDGLTGELVVQAASPNAQTVIIRPKSAVTGSAVILSTGIAFRNIADSADVGLTCSTLTASGGSFATASQFGAIRPYGAGLTTIWSVFGAQIANIGVSNGANIFFADAAETGWSDAKWTRYATGPAAQLQAAGGLRVRDLAGTADAPVTCSSLTVSGGTFATASQFGAIRPYAAGLTSIFNIYGGTIANIGVGNGSNIFFADAAETGWSDAKWTRYATGPAAQLQAAGGLRVRDLAGTADAPLACSGITASGGATITGGGVSSTGGLKVGSYGASIGGIWNSTLTPSTSNYALAATATTSHLNATTSVSLAIGGTDVLYSTAAGMAIYVPITTSSSIQETYRTSSLDPTVSDIGSGKRQGWYNTTATEFRDWVNVGGTLYKSAAYT